MHSSMICAVSSSETMFNMRTRMPVALLLAGAAVACSEPADTAAPVATPSLSLSRPTAPIGSPVDMKYRFVVAQGAPAFTEDYTVFVHFVDRDGELMWTDDHAPPTPTREWKPGATVEYDRTMFVPKFPYVGETQVEVGLYSPSSGQRVPLAGQTDGDRAYRVASFSMRLQDDPLFIVYKDGWYDTEIVPDGIDREWRWSRRAATLSFRHPKRAIRLFMKVDQPVAAAFTEPQQVVLRIGDALVDQFPMTPGGSDLRRIEIPADRLGSAETVELVVSVDKTFVPASVPALRSTDGRELGIRVFHAYAEPL